ARRWPSSCLTSRADPHQYLTSRSELCDLSARRVKLFCHGGRNLSQRQLLYSEVADFADIEDVLGAAIDRVDRAELLPQPARPAELADDRSIEAHLVDLAGGIEIVRRVGIRHV